MFFQINCDVGESGKSIDIIGAFSRLVRKNYRATCAPKCNLLSTRVRKGPIFAYCGVKTAQNGLKNTLFSP